MNEDGLISRNVTIYNKRTSIRLEKQMWQGLKDIAQREDCTVHDICTLVSISKNEKTSLTASIRIFIMMYYKAAATEDGHSGAGHGSFQHMLKRFNTVTKKGQNAEVFREYFGTYLRYSVVPNYAN
jgi:predicted DNA-binding ribbon-helix-helix protein